MQMYKAKKKKKEKYHNYHIFQCTSLQTHSKQIDLKVYTDQNFSGHPTSGKNYSSLE